MNSVMFCSEVKAQKYIMTYLYGVGNYSEMIEERENNFNEVSPSYFDINENGTLKVNYIEKTFVNKMKDKGIRVVPFLSNHWDRECGRKAVQNHDELAAQITEAVIKNELDGVNVDIENLTESDRENYTNLVIKLREKLPKDKILAVSVAANPTGINFGWQGSYDYKKIAQYADYIMIMAYDEHYEGGEAGPVASIEFVEKSIQYALSCVEKEKIVLGLPLYGRCWNTSGSINGLAVSLKQIQDILKKYDSKVLFDSASKTPRADVVIKNTDDSLKIAGKALTPGRYEFWFENEESINIKMDLIEKYDIKGVGMWKIGLETESVWSSIINKIDEIAKEVKNLFDDVSSKHWGFHFINFVNNKGIMIGKSQLQFEPEASLTRAELATIISRVIEDKNIKMLQENQSESGFIDIAGHWGEENILKLQNMGFVKGYDNNEFRPNNKVTRAEVCAIIGRLLKYIECTENYMQKQHYSDLSLEYWAYQDIYQVGKYGIVNGYLDGTFGPEKEIKRVEIAKIIQKIYEISV